MQASSDISVVATLYYSEKYIEEFYARVVAALKEYTNSYEIIFVDDGSPDKSVQKARHLINLDKNVKLIELSRNFGHHKAIMAGLERAIGDKVFLIDIDLEERPELLHDYMKIMKKEPEIDVVYGYMIKRDGGFSKAVLGGWFHKIINAVSDMPIPRNTIMARLMKREYVLALVRFRETHFFIGGIMELAGFNKIGIAVEKSYKGSSTYNFPKRFVSAIDAVFSFSNRPLVWLLLLGLLICASSLIGITYIFIKKFFFTDFAAGWPSLIASIWFVGGIMTSAIGLVGLYISKIFIQVKDRPNYIIRKLHNF